MKAARHKPHHGILLENTKTFQPRYMQRAVHVAPACEGLCRWQATLDVVFRQIIIKGNTSLMTTASSGLEYSNLRVKRHLCYGTFTRRFRRVHISCLFIAFFRKTLADNVCYFGGNRSIREAVEIREDIVLNTSLGCIQWPLQTIARPKKTAEGMIYIKVKAYGIRHKGGEVILQDLRLGSKNDK